MRSSFTKFAAAAVIIIAIVAGLTYFEKTSSVAWGDIAKKVEQIKTVTYTMKMKMKGMPDMPLSSQPQMEIQMKAYQSSEYGMRMDSFMGGKLLSQTYIPTQDKNVVTVMHNQKKYMKMHLTDEMFDKIRQQSGDPKKMIEEFMKNKYTELEPNTINGIKVQGIESRDPKMGAGMFDNVLARIWVNVQTDLPVLMEMQFSGKGGQMEMNMMTDEFDWGAELDKSLFEPNIPADYSLMAEVSMPSMQDVNAFTDGLNLAAKWTGGKYPSSISMVSGMQEVSVAWKQYRDPNAGQPSKEDMQDLMKVQMAYMFYAELIKADKDPCYYGAAVTALDTDAVLLRYKIDDVNYRVVFGDLSIEDMSRQQLSQLEANNPTEILHDIKPPRPVIAFAGNQADKWHLDASGIITAHCSLTVAKTPLDAVKISVSLPYSDAKLQSAKVGDIELQFNDLKNGKYELLLPENWSSLQEKTIEVIWTIPLASLEPYDKGFRAELKGLIPLYSYSLDFILDDNCGYENTADPTVRSIHPFNWNNPDSARAYLGSCGLMIQKSQ